MKLVTTILLAMVTCCHGYGTTDQSASLVQQLADKVEQLELLLQAANLKLSQQEKLLQHQQERLNQQPEPTVDQERLQASGKGRTRSDDSGPTEAVIDQLSQQVARISAELEALKAQSGSHSQTLSSMTQQFTTIRTDLHSFQAQTLSDLQALKTSSSQQALDIQDGKTSVFVRWGSSHCDSPSQLVYAGVLGGSLNSDSGAATDFLCLTLSPVFSGHRVPLHHGWVTGGEYQTDDQYENKDPVCAVCRAPFSTTIMIPGTNVCSPGWHTQYSGYLMTGHPTHTAASQYVCVDAALESRPNSEANQEGKLLYFTLSHCGPLPCSPYADNRVVTCVVCSL